MSHRTHPIVEAFLHTSALAELRSRLPRGGERLGVGGCQGSAASALLAALHETHPSRVFVALAGDPEGAERLQADLESLLDPEAVHLFPQSETRFYSEEETDLRIEGLRIEAIEALLGNHARLFVATPRALQERMAIPDHLARLRLKLSVGEEVGFSILVEELETMGYTRVPLAEETGHFAVRGGLLDVFSLGFPDPVRIEFWGDEISSIRAFDVATQRSTQSLEEINLLPASLRPGSEGGGSTSRSLLEILPTDTLLFDLSGGSVEESFHHHWSQAERIRSDRMEGGEKLATPDSILIPADNASALLAKLPLLRADSAEVHPISLHTTLPPEIERKMDRLVELLSEEERTGGEVLILCDNSGQVERLEEILSERLRTSARVQIGVGAIEAGFRLPGPSLLVLTDHEIFQRGRRTRSGRRFKGTMALESLAQLSPGDYVVHMDHGIGRFRGLERVEIGGEALEVLAIDYADGETLRVPVYRLDLVERWIGAADDSEPPSVHKIGGKKWKTQRRKAEEAIEQITEELLELYAEREVAEGFAFSADTRWQREMEAAFLYDDTPDQRSATEDVKRDMESPRPMDRLICGDVGFGKTEVAIRAAFKAVQDGKQVAVLAPTTILAEQHLRTFQERLADFPVRISSLSRFRTAGEEEETRHALERGEVDVVIGTHRLLSGDVRFRELGLLIIDEEQRFGVKHKEKLKELRAAVDVLTLTATPIPRTLQLSLTGIRNLSLIRTPPRDRQAVSTHAIPWNEELLIEIVMQEIDRGGQVFFLHNRVDTIHSIAERLRRLIPEVRIGVAHGQMNPHDLEEAMRAFISGETDLLVCSSIIENGIDVPRANTLIVDRADRFGLSQLYQIRGRVGRSDRRAYCYLIVPEEMTEESRQRIRILERHTELGSGYQIALHDLELRGAGNLLGADQSGFAHSVGMDTYLRLLENAVKRLRRGPDERSTFPEPEVSLPGSAYLPDGYVSDSGQKVHLYRRLSKLEDRAEADRLREEMVDRFGPLPEEVDRLLDAHLLRILGRELGLERIYAKGREGRITFRASANPRMSALEGLFRDRQVQVEVKRMIPLSLSLHHAGTEALTKTLIRALEAMVTERARAA